MLEPAIPKGDAAIVFLAERLGAFKALDEIETRVLHLAIRRDRGDFRRWTDADDAKLRKMHKARLGAAHIAATLNRTEDSVRRRLCDLKKKDRINGR